MSVRFVVGRAGSGKTWRCLEAVRARLRKHPADGNRLLLLVPEQASFQMERALIAMPEIAGYTRCEVVSFRRLAHRVFAETGLNPRQADQTIGPLGRMMAIRRLIRRERPGLRLLDKVADKPGLVKVATDLFGLGFRLLATAGTARFLAEHGLDVETVFKVNEGRPHVVDRLLSDEIQLVINTPLGAPSFYDERSIRVATLERHVPLITTLSGAASAVEAIRHRREGQLEVRTLQDLHQNK